MVQFLIADHILSEEHNLLIQIIVIGPNGILHGLSEVVVYTQLKDKFWYLSLSYLCI
jgi:hypothetical protein